MKGLFSHMPEAAGVSEEQALSVSLHSYASHMDCSVSDHRPVSGTFELEVGKAESRSRKCQLAPLETSII